MDPLAQKLFDDLSISTAPQQKLPYAGYVDPESTLALGVHHDGHLEADSWAMFSVLIRLRKGVLQN